MEIPTIYVFTHDSIGLGEDGPTHQPIEQLASLRAMPDLMVLRPGDANEVVEAWKVIMQLKHEPADAGAHPPEPCPLSTARNMAAASGVAKGAYVLADAPDGKPDVILMGTGSEVSLCVNAYEKLKAEGVKARVVSMPSWNFSTSRMRAYKDKRSARRREGASRRSKWPPPSAGHSYVGPTGIAIGMHRFGASAPMKDLQKKFGFTTENVVAAARKRRCRKK